MLDRIKSLFSREKKFSIESYLKKLSIDRQDLIKDISTAAIDVDSPVNAYVTLAILLREKGEYYKSLKILEKLKRENISQNERKLVILNLALVYKAAGFIDRAEEALREGIETYPGESFFYYELARIKESTGKLEEAVDLLEKAVELKEEFKDDLIHVKLYLANRYIDLGRTDKAFKIVRKLDLSFPVPLYYYVLAKLFYSVGERDKGYRIVLKGIKLAPGKSAPFVEVVEKFDELSEEKLIQLVEESEFSSPPVKKLVQFLVDGGNLEKALLTLQQFWDAGRFDPELFETYIKILWETGRRKRVAEEVIALISRLKEKKKLYKCENCGFKTDTFDWICPKCRSWETLEIESEV